MNHGGIRITFLSINAFSDSSLIKNSEKKKEEKEEDPEDKNKNKENRREKEGEGEGGGRKEEEGRKRKRREAETTTRTRTRTDSQKKKGPIFAVSLQEIEISHIFSIVWFNSPFIQLPSDIRLEVSF